MPTREELDRDEKVIAGRNILREKAHKNIKEIQSLMLEVRKANPQPNSAEA